ncbi:MAG: metallo-mystery pair system four-Cys motif protein [Synechococcaceae cyanobacterium SM2_3_1]|nr:metallo-mystery pair system four-Cys motif protein [Synechococcaceae cyanobacterium SM2_3_1]
MCAMSSFQTKLVLGSLVTMMAGVAFQICSETQAEAADPETATIQFAAMVGGQPFACGQRYPNLGSAGTEVTPTDFRFYVSEVALIDAEGTIVPVSLEQDGIWQYESVALLDFEDKSGPCANGTTETRDQVVGTVPAGDYQGLQFTLGIPFELNHEDATLASSPLNLTSMWWNWQGGYKFVRIDLELPMEMDQPESQNHGDHSHVDHAYGAGGGFLIHLGSTGCGITPGNQKPDRCSNRNAPLIRLDNFNLAQDVVIADLAALVVDSDLSSNAPDTALGCMSGPEDGDCVGILANLGLGSDTQTFFQVK